MLTLNDLKPRTVEVQIIMGKLPPEEEGGPLRDDVRIVPLRVPSWVEWNELGMEIPTPEPETVTSFKGGKKTYEKESGAAYQEKVTEANNKRLVRRLTFALIEAGNFPELKNASADEQIEAIGSMDAGVLQALAKTLNQLVQFTSGRIAEKAERFRPAGPELSENGHADMQPDAVEFG